eukprot:1040207-Pyramimonas_sp.AAC.1
MPTGVCSTRHRSRNERLCSDRVACTPMVYFTHARRTTLRFAMRCDATFCDVNAAGSIMHI